MNSNKLSLYIHIPFCVRKCDYCDFLSAPADAATREAYIQALLMEIESYGNTERSQRDVISVFIGGGTPSVLEEDQITRLMNKIKAVFLLSKDCEVSIEINPGTVTKEKCNCYFKNGINRVSIGLQSPDDNLLKLLGRIHTYEQFLETYENVRAAGFENVNIDLMSALPGQTAEQYCIGLERVASLQPEHISAYSLILEEGTPFYERYPDGCDEIPDEKEDRLMYERTKAILQKLNYERYEISNYAKPGYECRHNAVYWQRGDYLGLGLGSASLINNCRYKNISDLNKYLLLCNEGLDISGEKQGIFALGQERECLSVQAQMEEFMFLGLRMMKGVSEEEFYRQFGCRIDSVYGDVLVKLQRQGLLQVYHPDPGKERYYALTEKGIDVSNYIFEQFLL